MKINVEKLNAAKRRTGKNVNLAGASLDGANLAWASLAGANLTGASLAWASLAEANLAGANLNWMSHDLLSEILRQAAHKDIAKLMLAGLPLVTPQLCWGDYLRLEIAPELRQWVVATLAPFAKDDENAPNIFRRAAEEL